MNEHFEKKADSVYSKRLKAGKRRTYFFDVRATRGNDYFLTITESRKRQTDDGYDRHKIFLYKEDFNKFIRGLNEAVDFVKTELMPDFDFDSFNHDQSEIEGTNAGKPEIVNELLEPDFTPATSELAFDGHNGNGTVAHTDIIDGTDRAGFEGHSPKTDDGKDGHDEKDSKSAVDVKYTNNSGITEDVDRW